ncbi:hypothetical protein [Streptomyces sp. NPDC058247]|uniref:hypothetical protein n=1 Tax=Streptomyces sp. NPDC058247 TaxID=3346401 RepID=UPI0036EEB481
MSASRFEAFYPPFAWPRITNPRRRHLSIASAAEATPTRAQRPTPRVAAVVAPYQDAGHATELARLGWRRIAVELAPGLLPQGATPQLHGAFIRTVVHDGLRRTVRELSAHGVQAVVAGSPAGVPLADQLAHELGVPGNAPSSTAARCDLGAQSQALADHGVPTPRTLRTTSLVEALSWAEFCALPAYEVTAADTGSASETRLCRTGQEISDAWRTVGASAPRRGGSPVLALREHIPGRRYVVNTFSGHGDDGTPEHTVTDVWSTTQTTAGALDRMDLMPRQSLLWRSLSLYTLRVLRALEVSVGPVRCEVAYAPGRGPVLIKARAYPEVSAAARAVREALGSDPYRDAVHGAIVGRRRQPVGSPGPLHLTQVPLLPTEDGHLDRWLLRTLTQLETVTHVDDALMPQVAVHGGTSPGELVLRHSSAQAIEADYRVIRAVERLGLYEGGLS